MTNATYRMRLSKKAELDEQTLRQRIGIGFLATLAVGLVTWQLVLFFTKPPAVLHDHLRYIQLLRTACSSQRQDYLIGVEKSIQAQEAKESFPDAERKYFDRILRLAKDGDWEAAERLAMQLEEAQLSRRRSTP